jgi:hypothetical protein
MSTDMKTAAETRQDARTGLDQQRQQALRYTLYNVRVNASYGHTWIFGRVQHARYVVDNLRVLGYRVILLGFGYIVVRW